MKVRLGYVAIALNLPKVTTSSTVTFTNYNKISGDENKLNKLKKVALTNLDDLYTILNYNVENEIHFYRITSKLIPLCNHPEVMWNYREFFRKDFKRIGDFIKKNNMRVDTHPDQFNVLNSTKDNVVKNTINNLWAHVNLFQDLGIDDGKMILHIGSGEGGKAVALERFRYNFKNVIPKEIKEKIILENDDKTFTVKEVLKLCMDLDIPMVLDVHHHLCNNNGEEIRELLPFIFNTWNKEKVNPKIHFSSPREHEKDRKHSDYIKEEDFIEFINIAKTINRDFDVMLEAKKKDLALIKLNQDIQKLNKDFNWIDKSTFII